MVIWLSILQFRFRNEKKFASPKNWAYIFYASVPVCDCFVTQIYKILGPKKKHKKPRLSQLFIFFPCPTLPKSWSNKNLLVIFCLTVGSLEQTRISENTFFHFWWEIITSKKKLLKSLTVDTSLDCRFGFGDGEMKERDFENFGLGVNPFIIHFGHTAVSSNSTLTTKNLSNAVLAIEVLKSKIIWRPRLCFWTDQASFEWDPRSVLVWPNR